MILQLKDIVVSRAGKQILNGVSLSVDHGDKIIITGESGSGKSTLIKSLLFFEPMDSGEVLWQGTPVNQHNIQTYRQSLGYVGQKPPNFEGRVLDYFLLPWTFINNCGDKPSEEVVAAYMDQFDLSKSLLDQEYRSLSGGEQQRMTLIQTLLLQRPVLVLDEVTSSLDPARVNRVVDVILSDPERSVVAVSHQNRWLSPNVSVYEIREGKLYPVEGT